MYFIPLNYDVIVSRAALTKIFSAYIPRSALSAFRDSPQVSGSSDIRCAAA